MEFPPDDELIGCIRRLAQHGAAFEAPGFSFGEWVAPVVGDDGVIQLGWYSFSAEANAFIHDAYGGGCIIPFDWSTWIATPHGRALAADPHAIDGAPPGDLLRLLTTLVRSDRFSEGSLAQAFESGVLTAIIRRARDLANAPDG